MIDQQVISNDNIISGRRSTQKHDYAKLLQEVNNSFNLFLLIS